MKFSFVQNGGAPQTERRFCSRFRITQGPKIKNNETEIDNIQKNATIIITRSSPKLIAQSLLDTIDKYKHHTDSTKIPI